MEEADLSLTLRKEMPGFFEDADYQPIPVEGKHRHHVIAFLRGKEIGTVCPRLIMSFDGNWEDTLIKLPNGTWVNRLTKDIIPGRSLFLKDLFKRFPVALLSRNGV